VAAVYLIGSCARGDWGVGTDLDFIIMVHRGNLPMIRRSIGVDTSALPVAADVQVYTQAEWGQLDAESPHVRARYQREMMDLPGVA
jgi:predicted nucleotidyltransferase